MTQKMFVYSLFLFMQPFKLVRSGAGKLFSQNSFSKGSTENWSRDIFAIDSMLNTNPHTYTITDFNPSTI